MPDDKPKRKNRQMVKIESTIYERAKKKAADKGVTLQNYVNETLLLNIEKDDFLKDYAPHLYLAAKDDMSLFIRDEKKNRTAEIVIKDKELICYLCEQNDCEHVHFALALPEIALFSFKMPRKSKGAPDIH